MVAEIVHHDDVTNTTLYQVGDHEIQFGGPAGDGYCYSHQTFDCKLTKDEQKAVSKAKF